jgi:pSer/pThr/pTyr-binding forkhead associated (FHA) protein
MRDGRTRRLGAGGRDRAFARFLAGFRPAIVVIEGSAVGTEHAVESPTLTLGRGPGVDLVFPDPAMSKEHACLEWASGSLRLRDLGSMNGVRVNGSEVQVAELEHGDRFQLGEHVFQLVVEKRRREPPTYVLPDA